MKVRAGDAEEDGPKANKCGEVAERDGWNVV